MTTYTIVKNPGRSGWLIDDGVTGTSIRYRTKAEAQRTIDQWIEHEERDAYWTAEEAKYRLTKVEAYLAQRAARKAATPEQLRLF